MHRHMSGGELLVSFLQHFVRRLDLVSPRSPLHRLLSARMVLGLVSHQLRGLLAHFLDVPIVVVCVRVSGVVTSRCGSYARCRCMRALAVLCSRRGDAR